MQRTDSDSAAFIVWASVCITTQKLSFEAAGRLVLWQVYGRNLVARDHLFITQYKPQLIVSNGDILRGLGALHFLYGVGLWIPTTVAILILSGRYFAPRWWKQASNSSRRQRPGAF